MYVGMGALPMTNDWIDTTHGHMVRVVNGR